MTRALALLLLAACATVKPEAGHADVARLVEERTGQKTHWESGVPAEADIQRWVDGLLAKGLSRDTAVSIALVNNPALQETYEELGISQADLVQAGLLKNPTLSAHYGFALDSSLSEIQGSLVQDFLDLFVLPLRKSIAADQFAADVHRVASQALSVAAEVTKALAAVQASQQEVALQQEVLKAQESSAALARQLRQAGNISELALDSQLAAYEQSRLELARAQLDLVERRTALDKLLGLWGPRAAWKLDSVLPALPEADSALDQAEAIAVRRRLDIEAARRQAELFSRAVDLASTSRAFGLVQLGVDFHRDADGPRIAGPSLTLELPIFDQRQAMIARLQAQQRASERRLSMLAVEARSDARLGRQRLGAARQLVQHYERVVLPLRGKVVEQAQLHYNGMVLGLPALLDARREQLQAQRAAVEALRDYWFARAELERVLGGPLP